MKTALALAIAAGFAANADLADSNPFEAFRGKVKEGMYEYKMEMDMGQMPNMPPGMGKQAHTFQHCVTPEDVKRGEFGKDREGKMPKDCQIKDFKMSGNTASYKMICTGERAMATDNTITFAGDGYRMKMKMDMDHGGQKMTMNQTMDAKYLGACPAAAKK
jgi:hypothetical protein